MPGSVDVIIPVYRPDAGFLAVISALFSQSVRPGRVILLETLDKDGASALPEGIAAFPVEIYPVLPEEFDHGHTRNEGIHKSSADHVLFMTQDALPADDQLIEKLLEPFGEYPLLAASYARQLPREDAGKIEACTRAFNYPETSLYKSKENMEELGIKSIFLSDVCAMYDRKKFVELGGFVDRTIFNEDMIYAYTALEAGYGVFYQAEAKVYHSHHYSGKENFRRNFDLAVSQADHPEVFERFPSEGEGMKLVRETASKLVKSGSWYLVFPLVYESGMKYLGYHYGKRYRKLSAKRVQRCTMNRNYWRGTKWDRSK